MKNSRPGVVAAAVAAALLFPPFGIAGDIAKLTGKNLSRNRGLVDSAMTGRNYVVEVDRHGNIKQVVDAGANGSGKAPQPITSPSAVAHVGLDRDTVSSVELPINYQSQTAIDFIGVDLAKVAERHSLTPDKLKEMLLADSTMRVDSGKHIFFVDDSTDGHNQFDGPAAGGVVTATTTNNPQLPIGMTPATVDAFKLHSKPKANKTIYLDFNGETVANSAWSKSTLVAPPYDLDGTPTAFNGTELANIISIWNRVAEDYIPFDVDVTTEEPPIDALQRTSVEDVIYGTRVVITKTGTINCSCGGVAYVGVVAAVGASGFQPAWVFQQSLANNEKYIAEAISHEAGHNLGLSHDGQKTSSATVSYYTGHGDGATSWAPIMGVGYYKSVTQWSSGQYPNASNLQDDLAVFAANGFVLRTDDVGNSITAASPLPSTLAGASATVKTSGVIGSQSDIDMYRLDTSGGLLELKASPTAAGANLDAKITLLKADGTPLIWDAPESALSASISTTVAAGTYYLSVRGSSHAAQGTDYGYPGYGSLGQYQITGSYPAPVISSAAAKTVPTSTKSVEVKAAPTTAKVYAASLRLKLIKNTNVMAKAAVTVVDRNKRPVTNAIVRGVWSGAFSGAVSSKTGANGVAIHTGKPVPAKKGGAANFTLTKIEVAGHAYRPGRNDKRVVTVSW